MLIIIPILVLDMQHLLFFPRVIKTITKTGGERKVPKVNCKKQTELGNTRGQSSHKHYDRRFTTNVYSKTNSFLSASSRVKNLRKNICSIRKRIHSHVAEIRRIARNLHPTTSSFFSPIHASKEKRKKSSYNRSFKIKSFTRNSNFHNGDSVNHCEINCRRSLGLLHRHKRCLLSPPHQLGFPQIFCLQTEKQNFCFPISSLWSVNRSLGVYKSHLSDQKEIAHVNDSDFQLFRRLYPFCQKSRGINRRGKCGAGFTSEIGVHNKLGKIGSRTSACSGIFGSKLESDRLFFIRSGRQNSNYNFSLSKSWSKTASIETNVGEPFGAAELRGNLRSIGQVASASSDDLDEPSNTHFFQRQDHSAGSEVFESPKNLDKSGIPGKKCSNSKGNSKLSDDDGCIIGRLVRGAAASQGSGFLGARGSTPFNELEGTYGSLFDTAKVQTSVGRQMCSSTVRQHDDSSMPEKTGFSEISTSSQSVNEDSGILQGQLNCLSSKSSKGSVECSGRQGIEGSSHFDRVDVRSEVIRMGVSTSSESSNRFIRDERECSISEICVPMSRRNSRDLGRVQCGLEHVVVHLPVSTLENDSGSSQPGTEFSRERGSHSPVLANSELVPTSSTAVQNESDSVAEVSSSESDDFEGFSGHERVSILESSRLATIRNAYGGDLSVDSLNMVDLAHKESTKRQYQSIWNKFLGYLDDNVIPHNKVNIAVVMNFLAFHAVTFNRQYRTIAAYKCALDLPLKSQFGIDFDDFRMKFFMRGVFNAKPPKKCAPMPIWSLNELLEYLNCEFF